MSATATYNQCKMERANADGSKTVHVAWIPSEFAKIGKHVEFLVDSDSDDEVWSKGWIVRERGAQQSRSALDQQRSARNSFAVKLDSKKRR